MFYLLPSPATNSWTPHDFTRYLSQYQDLKSNFLRPRVTEGVQLYAEYISRYLSENYFEQIFSTFLKLKNTTRDHLNLDFDLKTLNKDWGKKNMGKKGQMRTLLNFSFPIIMNLIVCSSLLVLILSLSAYRLFC